MGKKAKIGLAAALVSFIVLGVVLAQRLTSTSSASADNSSQPTGDETKDENASSDSKKKSASAKPSPKVLTPNASSHSLKGNEGKAPSWDNDFFAKKSPSSSAGASAAASSSGKSTKSHPNDRYADDRYSRDRYADDRYSDNRYANSPAAEATDSSSSVSGYSEASAGDTSVSNSKKPNSDPFETRSRQDFGTEGLGSTDENIASSSTLPAPPLPQSEAYAQSSSSDRNRRSIVASNPKQVPSSASLEESSMPNDLTAPSKNRSSSRDPDYYSQTSRTGLSRNEGENQRSSRIDNSHLGNIPHRSRMGSNGGMATGRTYEVQPNDKFWTISKKFYGTNSYFKALEEYNRSQLHDEQLNVGQTVIVPDVSELEQKYPELCPKPNHLDGPSGGTASNSLVSMKNHRGGKSYTVAEGDTLFDIARYELGKASRWVEIYELNRDVLGKDFDYLVPGTQLSLPQEATESPDPITRRPTPDRRY